MTFGEIYTRVCFNLWGNSAVPQGSAAVLQGDEGLIANAHRKIMQDYNYWFMHTWTTIPIYDGTQSYALPDEFKEFISAMFKVEGEEYFCTPLSPLGGQEAHFNKWPQNNATAEYPNWFEITDEAITLYPVPSENRTLHMVYWTFFPRPTTAGFTAAYDALTNYGADAIIFRATADMADILKEYDISDRFMMKYQAEIEQMQNENRRRMQAPLYEVKYSGVS